MLLFQIIVKTFEMHIELPWWWVYTMKFSSPVIILEINFRPVSFCCVMGKTWNCSYGINNTSHMAAKVKIYDLFKGVSLLYLKDMLQI